MSKSILQRLFEGEIYPPQEIGNENQELRKLTDKIVEAETRLSNIDAEIYQEFEDLKNKYNSIYAYESFSYGFRLGITLLFEALSNTENLARNRR